MTKPRHNPNPSGRRGRPVSLAPRTAEGALAHVLHGPATGGDATAEDVDAILALCEARGLVLADLSPDEIRGLMDEVSDA